MRDLTVVFDLDGTLVETAPDLIAATNHALRQCNLEPVSPGEIRPFISFGARAMIRRGLEFHGHHVSESRFEEPVLRLHRLLRREHCRREPSVSRTSGLSRRPGRSAARAWPSAPTSRKDYHASFSALSGLRRRSPPLPGAIRFRCASRIPTICWARSASLEETSRRAVMIGDSDVDIATAKAANIPIIAVTFGYTNVPIASLSPDAMIDHYRDLAAAIERVAPR